MLVSQFPGDVWVLVLFMVDENCSRRSLRVLNQSVHDAVERARVTVDTACENSDPARETVLCGM